MSIRRVSTVDFLNAAGEEGLPFRVIMKPDGRIVLMVDGEEIRASVLGEVKLQGAR